MRFFLDTNVLIYADDADQKKKQRLAQRLLEQAFTKRQGVISTQVLQEFFAVITKKLGVDKAIARRKVELLSTLEVVTIDVPLIVGAIDLHRLHALSFWDALIIKSAAAASCDTLYTEDLQAGAVLDGVRIVDPFG